MPGGRPAPVSTYRLQLQPGFGFADAAAVADYLADLGVTHAYLSPILQAAPGSTHGYDVVDHSRVSDDLGGEDGFRYMAARFRAPRPRRGRRRRAQPHGRPGARVAQPAALVGAAGRHRARRSRTGSTSTGPRRTAGCCCRSWAARSATAAATSAVDARPAAEPVLRYLEHVLPVRPGTADLPLADLLAAQHYRLDDWRLGGDGAELAAVLRHQLADRGPGRGT